MAEDIYDNLVDEMASGIVKSCNFAAAQLPDVDPAVLAARIATALLISIAFDAEKESGLITVRKQGDAWASHFHLDFLNADPEHIMADFHAPPADDNQYTPGDTPDLDDLPFERK